MMHDIFSIFVILYNMNHPFFREYNKFSTICLILEGSTGALDVSGKIWTLPGRRSKASVPHACGAVTAAQAGELTRAIAGWAACGLTNLYYTCMLA